MSKILRVALPIAFIVVFYAGEPAGTLFGCRAFNVIPPLIWLLLLVTLGAANAAIAFGLVRTERTRDLALWGLVLKVCFLPIFLVSLVVFALIGSQFSLRPEALPLEFALLTPYAVLSYALMIVTSCYGFAAIIRARDEQVIGGVWVFWTVCCERVVLSSVGCLWLGRVDDHEVVLEAHA